MQNPEEFPVSDLPGEQLSDGYPLRDIEAFSRRLNSSLDLDTVLNLLADALRALLGADRCAIFLYDSSTESTECVLARGLSRLYTDAISATFRDLPGGDLITQRFQVVEDALADPRMIRVREIIDQEGFRSILLVSLRFQDVALGAFAAYWDDVRQFDETVVAVAQTLANQAAVALKNAQSYMAAQERLEELEKLHCSAVEISREHDLPATLAVIVSQAADVLEVHETRLYLNDPDRSLLELRAGHNIARDEIGQTLEVDEDWGQEPQTWQDQRGSMLQTTLRHGDRVLAVLVFADPSGERIFGEADLRMASHFSYQTSGALTSALLSEECSKRADYLMALQRVGTAVTATLEFGDVLQAVVEELRNTFEYSLTSIHRLQDDTLVLQAAAFQFPQEKKAASGLNEGIIGRVARLARAECVTDVAQDQDYLEIVADTVTEAAVPIFLEGRVWGVLNVEASDRTTLDPSVLPLLEMLGYQIGVAIRNAESFAESRQRVAELEALRQSSLQQASSLDTRAMIETIVQSAMALVRPKVVHLYLYDARREEFTLSRALSDTGERNPAVPKPRKDGIVATTVDLGAPLIINDAIQHPLFGENPDPSVREWGVTAIGAFPLVRPNGILGVLTISFTRRFEFTESVTHVLSLLADQAAVALENARLFELEAERRQLADTLRHMAAAVSSAPGFTTAAETILDYLGKVISYDTAAIVVLEGDRFDLGAFAGEFAPPPMVVAGMHRTELPACDHVVLTGQPLVIQNTEKSERWRKLPGGQLEVRSWLGVPLRHQGEVFGTLNVDSGQYNAFSQEDVQIVQSFADQVATGLINARLHETVRWRAEEAERLRDFNDSILRGVEAGILLEDDRDRIEYVNPRLCQMVGYCADELLGRQSGILLTPEMDKFVSQQSSGRPAGIKGRYEASLLHKEGHEIPVLVNATPTFRSGVFQGTLTAFTDITLRKHTEENLLALNKAATAVRRATEPRDVYDTISEELQRLGLSSVIMQVDEKMEFGSLIHMALSYEFSDEKRRGFFQTLDHRQYRISGIDALERVLMDGQAEYVEGLTEILPRWLRPEEVIDDSLWDFVASLRAVIAPLVSRDRRIGILAVMGDHLQQADVPSVEAFANQMSVALDNARLLAAERRERERAEALGEVARILSSTQHLVDALGQVLKQLRRLVDFDSSSLLLYEEGAFICAAAEGFDNPEAVVGSEFDPGEISLLAEMLRSPQVELIANTLQDERWKDLPGSEGVTSWMAAPLTADGRLVGVLTANKTEPDFYGEPDLQVLAAFADQISVAIDRARLHRDTLAAYHELRQLDRMKDEFVQNVSHELRTPLTFVRGYVEYLLEGYAGDLNPEQKEALEIVLDRGNAIIDLVNGIISLKQAEMQAVNLRPISLQKVALACVQGALVSAGKAGVELRQAYDPQLPQVYGDSKQLGQVFDNLVGNAIKFSPDGGVVTVRLTALSDVIHAQVSDTGIGIPADRQEKIWDRFYQVDGASTRRFGGTGLGLAIVRRIIDDHNGKLWVESEVEKGSTFHFTIPTCSSLESGLD